MSKRPSLADKLKNVAEESEQQASEGGRANSRKGKKLLLTPVAPSTHKKLKVLAAQNETTMERLVESMIEDSFNRYDRQNDLSNHIEIPGPRK